MKGDDELFGHVSRARARTEQSRVFIPPPLLLAIDPKYFLGS